ncbi:hypothetical protein GCM10009119_19340 [Algoriphagus jejuensis]|uniref:HTH cro/C1-type domain-containing protein n=1 Tax=Algoriphagus jejuensis TaxID=419934 RepID=A0ABP3YC24_9BACT
MDSNINENQLEAFEKDFKTLQSNLGSFLEQAREKLGIKNPEDFANTYGYTTSQYREYESGRANPTLLTIFKLIKLLGLEANDLFNFGRNKDQILGEEVAEKARKSKIEQLREQVAIIRGRKFALEITDGSFLRIFQTLAFCTRPRTKAEILTNLNLKNTTNNFQRSVGLALELSWLEMTNPTSPNSPNQRYIVTEKGKGVV